jgi:hypothetical protein
MGLGAQVTRHVSRLMASMPRHGGGRPPAFVASINGKKARKMLSHSAALDHESLCSLVCMHYSVLPRRRHHFDHLFHWSIPTSSISLPLLWIPHNPNINNDVFVSLFQSFSTEQVSRDHSVHGSSEFKVQCWERYLFLKTPKCSRAASSWDSLEKGTTAKISSGTVDSSICNMLPSFIFFLTNWM